MLLTISNTAYLLLSVNKQVKKQSHPHKAESTETLQSSTTGRDVP